MVMNNASNLVYLCLQFALRLGFFLVVCNVSQLTAVPGACMALAPFLMGLLFCLASMRRVVSPWNIWLLAD